MSKKKAPSKTAKEKAAKLPGDLHKQVFVRVQEGHQGYHAIIEGGDGLWAASPDGAADAVLKAVSRHVMLPALEEAEEAGKLLRIDLREVGEQLWLVETGFLENPGIGMGRIALEPRGQVVSEVIIDPAKVDRPVGRRAAKAALKMAAAIFPFLMLR